MRRCGTNAELHPLSYSRAYSICVVASMTRCCMTAAHTVCNSSDPGNTGLYSLPPAPAQVCGCSSGGTDNAGSWLHVPPPKLLPEANRSWLLCVGCEEQCGVSRLAEPGDHHATVTEAPTVSKRSAPGNIGCTCCPPPRCATATTTCRARGYMLLHNTRGYCEDHSCGIMCAETTV